MILAIHPENPQMRKIDKAVEILKNDGVIIYPTDTVYGLGCDINSKKAIEQICKIKNMNPKKAEFSIVCTDISEVSNYTHQISNKTFKLMKRTLPGPFTYILRANNELPDTFRASKKTIGIRIPNHKVAIAIAERLGRPIISTSMNKFDDEIIEYYTNPELIHEKYQKVVEAVIDSGRGGLEPSTVVNVETDDWEIIRQGKGELVL